jgi:hypothetical protein
MMEFLERNQISEWAAQRGLERGEGFDIRLPDLVSRGRKAYARGGRSGRERVAAADLVQGLGTWDECLVWIRLWGVWPSSEDWPRFYAWRGGRGERRSLEVAPGHRFDSGESSLLSELLTLIMENAWDAEVMCSRSGRADTLRAKISHDEWYEILDASDG